MKLSASAENSKFISSEYRTVQEQMHETHPDYGTAGETYAETISHIVNRMEVTHLLDYGCGANTSLAKSLKVDHKLKYQAYDPGVPRFSRDPVPAQMVVRADVLEHIEPEKLDAVLDHIARLAEGIVFLSVCTAPALKTLPDGRNAHLIVEPVEWWLPKLLSRWDWQTVQRTNDECFFFIGQAKVRIEAANGEALI